ncbi:MAG: endolytic transglycosylase MltG [Patescibacteria group bacterium]
MRLGIKKIVLAVCAMLFIFVVWNLFIPASFNKSEAIVSIGVGASVSEIGNTLHDSGVIRSRPVFETYVWLTRADRELKAGRFIIRKNLTLPSVVSQLVSGKSGEIAVTFPEGFSIDEMDARLATMGLVERNAFFSANASQEGFLFPDTYFVNPDGVDVQELGRRMRENFEKKVTAGLADDWKKNKRSLKDTITMASIVEKEVRTSTDMPIVAGILWKRFDNDWPLGADATLLYGKDTRELDWNSLQENSPYNTRKFLGLPPTPIGNPGLVAIQAALNPTSSPYWFYLTTEDGTVIYASSNEEHNENKRKYLE